MVTRYKISPMHKTIILETYRSFAPGDAVPVGHLLNLVRAACEDKGIDPPSRNQISQELLDLGVERKTLFAWVIREGI